MARCTTERSPAMLPASLMLAALLSAPWSQGLAQAPDTAPRESVQPTTILLAPDRLAAPGMPKPSAPALPELGISESSTRLRAGTYDVLGSYVQLEMPRDLGNGTYSRPKLRFGMQSESLKSFASSMGLQPDRCTLPSFRTRSSASSDEVSGSVILLARCSFY